MGAGRRPLLEIESGAANWFHAALELRKSHRAALRVPIWGTLAAWKPRDQEKEEVVNMDSQHFGNHRRE
ncbi:hypothetical protein NDU88_003852 [Pleurodeles waltl]|uniref:Uncharacterized protein n=1 Tax=Pleurodeles waltl TaxID=8319 RepID=A0AAV7NL21_PLEWA|nr:hypothetical protein NDU88_003852 [Pleurodeles waltl]